MLVKSCRRLRCNPDIVQFSVDQTDTGLLMFRHDSRTLLRLMPLHRCNNVTCQVEEQVHQGRFDEGLRRHRRIPLLGSHLRWED